MAAVLEFPTDTGPVTSAQAEVAFEVVADYAASLPANEGIGRLNAYRSRFDAIETALLADVVERDGGNTKGAETAAADKKRSRRAARRAAKRGAAVGKNPKLGDKLATGELSADQLDQLNRASGQLGDEVLTDEDLLESLFDASDDETKRIIDDYIADKSEPADVEAEDHRQRRLRRVTKFRTNDDNLSALMIAGDDARIHEMWQAIRRGERSLFRSDGGRDVAPTDHPRTRSQRLFDAAYGYLAGTDLADPARWPDASDSTARGSTSTTHGSGKTAFSSRRGGASTEERQGSQGGADNLVGPGRDSRAPRGSRRHTPKLTKTSARPSVVVMVPAAKLDGEDPDALAEMIGHGPIPDHLLANYLDRVAAGTADLLGMVLGNQGQPLWLSRSVRHATPAQFVALTVRDKGCGLCGSDPSDCDVHHIEPWNAPIRGKTDIDKLMLACDACHDHVHRHHLTVVRDPETGRYTTRPATPEEIAPPRPRRRQAPARE